MRTLNALLRLTGASGAYGAYTYSYDAAGNCLSRDRDGVVETYSYAFDSQRLAEVRNGGGLRSYQYDAAGNSVDDGELGFAFGEHNRMSEASVLGSPVADYGYNGRGERVKKFVQGTTVFLYGPGGELLAESGATLREHVYLEGVPLAVIVDDTDLYHVHTDHLGTPKKLTDGNGLVVWDAVYEPFGETTLETELVAYHLRFPGQYFDAETGLHYNYFRNYDPDTGR